MLLYKYLSELFQLSVVQVSQLVEHLQFNPEILGLNLRLDWTLYHLVGKITTYHFFYQSVFSY